MKKQQFILISIIVLLISILIGEVKYTMNVYAENEQSISYINNNTIKHYSEIEADKLKTELYFKINKSELNNIYDNKLLISNSDFIYISNLNYIKKELKNNNIEEFIIYGKIKSNEISAYSYIVTLMNVKVYDNKQHRLI